jgi:hypothetical protein
MNLLGDFSMGFYWSSTENEAYAAWAQRFSDGLQSGDVSPWHHHGSKSQTHSVRPIRAF